MNTMNTEKITRTFAVALVLVLIATGLWASPAGEEEPAAAADKQYVTDPSTGKVVVAPQYGGTITFAQKEEPAGPDTVISGVWAHTYVTGVSEKLAMADWATPRDKHDFFYLNPPTNTIGVLAESWSQPDPPYVMIRLVCGITRHRRHWRDCPCRVQLPRCWVWAAIHRAVSEIRSQ